MFKPVFLLYAAISFLLLVFTGCPVILDEEEPWELPEAKPMTDSNNGVTQGTGMGENGTITVILTVENGWIMEITIDGPMEDTDWFNYVTEEYIFIVYTTNLVDIIPQCCSPSNSNASGRAIIEGIIQAAKNALAKNKANGPWYEAPV